MSERNPWSIVIGCIVGGAVILGSALIARKIAEDYTREYIRKLVREKLLINLTIGVIELGLLVLTHLIMIIFPMPTTCLIANITAWSIAIFNGYRFLFGTIPSVIKIRNDLRGMKGYVVTHVLRISIVKELVEFNAVILTITVGVVAFTRLFITL